MFNQILNETTARSQRSIGGRGGTANAVAAKFSQSLHTFNDVEIRIGGDRDHVFRYKMIRIVHRGKQGLQRVVNEGVHLGGQHHETWFDVFNVQRQCALQLTLILWGIFEAKVN